MKVAIYTRVSTQDQKVDMQVSDLRRYCEQRGFDIFKEYSDEGVSGVKEKRPSLDELMADAKKRRFDAVICWRLDRFGRSLKHLIVSLDELKTIGVGFVSFKESIDLTTPTGRLMLHLLGAFAEFEKEVIRERVKAGVAHARAKGKRLGRRPLIDTRLLRTVADMRDKGMSIRQISAEIKVSKSLVHKSIQILAQKSLKYQEAKTQIHPS